jgi:hypothetical protein
MAWVIVVACWCAMGLAPLVVFGKQWLTLQVISTEVTAGIRCPCNETVEWTPRQKRFAAMAVGLSMLLGPAEAIQLTWQLMRGRRMPR